MAKEMGLDRAPIEFQTFYFSHVLVVPPIITPRVGQICPQAFSFFPELLDGVTCSKIGLELSFRKNLQFETHFWSLSHLVPEI